MSTRHLQPQTETESPPTQPANRTTTATVADSPSARAPKTFATGSTDALQNLVDEYNAAISVARSS